MIIAWFKLMWHCLMNRHTSAYVYDHHWGDDDLIALECRQCKKEFWRKY